MQFPPKTKKGLNAWTKFLLLFLVLLGVFLFLGLAYLEGTNYIIAFCLSFFLIAVVAVSFILQLMRHNLQKIAPVRGLTSQIKTLQSELQRAKETSLYKSTYLANISHEIRIPLSNILGMVKMLKNTDLDIDQQAQLAITEFSSEHLLQLVNMILDNSQSSDNEMVMEKVAIDIELDLSKLFKLFEYQAWEKGLDFEFKFVNHHKQKFMLLGDLAKIRQILVNLVNNAIKFTSKGKIEITVDNTATYDDFQVVTFYIKDTGKGMGKEELNHALNTLSERNVSVLKEYKNYGIGLSVTKKLVEFLGGDLKVESKEDEGTIFYFSLQMQKTLSLKQELQGEKPILFNKFDYRFNVLVAEDNKMNQKVIKFLLERQGAACTFVTNGLDAVNLYKVINFDMIFMDIYMPEMNGYDATRLIKSTEKYSKNSIPIIAVSASAFEEDIEQAKLAGVDEFLSKPIDDVKLNNLLSKYALRKENIS